MRCPDDNGTYREATAMSSIQDTINKNWAIRMPTQCLRCRAFIPFVQCIGEMDLDESAWCGLFDKLNKGGA